MKPSSYIKEEDVKSIATAIKQDLTDEEKKEVLKRYQFEQDQDQTATWNLVIENVIYQIVNERK